MPYREKSNLLALAAMLIAYVPYFAYVAVTPSDAAPMPNMPLLMLFAAVSILRMAILLLGYLWFRVRTPEDVREKADERDLAIERRSMSVAYYVLIFGMILVGAIMPFTYAGWTLVNSALFAIVLAEIIRCAVAAVGYRRSAA